MEDLSRALGEVLEWPGVSSVHGVRGDTHKALYERPQYLQQVQRDIPILSYMQSEVFRDQECGSGKHRQKPKISLF